MANLLMMKHIDLDAYICDKTQMSISEIMQISGEMYFRELEKKYLLEVLKMHNTLISTGGGAPCFFDNINTMKENGTVVYLKLDEKSLVNRLLNSDIDRPLIAGMDKKCCVPLYIITWYRENHFIIKLQLYLKY